MPQNQRNRSRSLARFDHEAAIWAEDGKSRDEAACSLDFDLFQNGLAKFGEAHQFQKQIFFGLLKPEFLATLNPVYE